MDLTSEKNIKKLLKTHGARPSRRFGQNFLIDKGAIREIIEAAGLKPDDAVLEIGPGIGVLTQELAKRAKKVIAIEKDKNMVEILKEVLRNFDNVEIICGDILKIPDSRFQIPDSYKVVANLPFYLTAPVIRQFLENTRVQPVQMTLVVQKEVGQRICARPAKMSVLAVSVQVYAEPKIISYISKKSFWPSPAVDATIIKIVPKTQNAQRTDLCMFFKIVKAGFSQPRKQLINNFSKALKIDKKKVEEWLWQNKIQPTQRAETLLIKDWVNLSKSYKEII